MLRLTRFRYIAAESLEHASSLLAEHGTGAMLMAAGTDLLVNIKHRVATPEIVVGIRHLPELAAFDLDADDWLTVGAGTRLARLESDPMVQSRYPALAHAAHLVSAPQIRTVATLGGNVCLDVRCNYYNQSQEWRKAIGYCMKRDSPICRVAPGGDRCWAVASADTVPVLIALGAQATVTGAGGSRRVPVESLYADDGLLPLTLQFGEIVRSIHLPPVGTRNCMYAKFRIRQSFDFPLVGVATSLQFEADGTVRESRIVLTAVASCPQRATAAEQALIGRRLDDEIITTAGAEVYRLAKPMDNTAGTIFHRKRMARVLVERSLRSLAEIPEAGHLSRSG